MIDKLKKILGINPSAELKELVAHQEREALRQEIFLREWLHKSLQWWRLAFAEL